MDLLSANVEAKSCSVAAIPTTPGFPEQSCTTRDSTADRMSLSSDDTGSSRVASWCSDEGKALRKDTMPESLLNMEYAVRGKLVNRAEDIKRDLLISPDKYPQFSYIIPANIGNPQAVGQKPITFNRQVLACLVNPGLLDMPCMTPSSSCFQSGSSDLYCKNTTGPNNGLKLHDHFAEYGKIKNNYNGDSNSNNNGDEVAHNINMKNGTPVDHSLDTLDKMNIPHHRDDDSINCGGGNDSSTPLSLSFNFLPVSSSPISLSSTAASPSDHKRQFHNINNNHHHHSHPGNMVSPFPDDVRKRAELYLEKFPSMGAYSHSKGVLKYRTDIAKWFEERDGYGECDPESIFLTDGASAAIRLCIELISSTPEDGILIPVPQYPLYSATLTRYKARAVEYYLDEASGWQLPASEIDRALTKARTQGTNVKAIVVINPGNPTGALLQEHEIEAIIKFCEAERIAILADEVYQENVYCEGDQFVSFRKVALRLKSPVELISFHSSSKGLSGECGMRGGLMQCLNISEEAMGIFYKMSCVSLCANTVGQAMLACILNPPRPGEPSYGLWHEETQGIFKSLQRKAKLATERLNEMEGVTCQKIAGAMYSFPRITLPAKAIEEAHNSGVEPDQLYCMEMLEEAGIVCVPGSGFGQVPGTYHYRATILPSEDSFAEMLDAMQKFHSNFLEKYKD